MSSVLSNGYSFQVEMNYRAVKRGRKILELPIHLAERSGMREQDEPEGASRVGADAVLASVRQALGGDTFRGCGATCSSSLPL